MRQQFAFRLRQRAGKFAPPAPYIRWWVDDFIGEKMDELMLLLHDTEDFFRISQIYYIYVLYFVMRTKMEFSIAYSY